MKKLLLSLSLLCGFSAVATDEVDFQGFHRLTADELNAVETSTRIAIRCTQDQSNSWETFYNGTSGRVHLPLVENMVFEWVATEDGKYCIKKSFATDEETAYLQNNNITTWGPQGENVAKFQAVKPFNGGSGVTSFAGGNCYEQEDVGGAYWVRLSLGDKWFNFNGSTYNDGTGVWTVLNIVDLSEYYKVVINLVKGGVTTTETKIMQVGTPIEVPEFEGYIASSDTELVKTADDNQVVTVTYTEDLNYSQEPISKQVTNDEVSTLIVDGMYIALQCKDTNGGDGYFFNGATAKTAKFQDSNFFKVVGKEGSTTGEFYLQQFTTGKYVGGSTASNSLVALVDDIASANAFTASVASPTGWTTKGEGVVEGVNTIRFTTNGTFLNTNQHNLTPKYFGGTGGYSVWYVYAYNRAAMVFYELEKTIAVGDGMFKDDTPGFYATTGVKYAAYQAVVAEANAIKDAPLDYTIQEAYDAIAAIEAVLQAEDDVVLDGEFTGVYTITNKDGNGTRGYLCDIESDYVWSSGKQLNGAVIPAKDDVYSQWAFAEVAGKRCMFNVGSRRFIQPTGQGANAPWVFSRENAAPITFVLAKDGVGTVEIRVVYSEEATYYMSISNGFDGPVTGYYAANDGGVPFVFERVGDLDPAIKEYMESLDVTGIEEVEVNGAAEYFDLNGRKVAQPAHGLYIVRQGSKVSKVIR